MSYLLGVAEEHNNNSSNSSSNSSNSNKRAVSAEMPLDEPALIGAVGVAWVWVVLTDFGVGIWPVRVVHRPRDRRPEFPQEPETDLVSPAPRAPPLNRREEEEEEEEEDCEDELRRRRRQWCGSERAAEKGAADAARWLHGAVVALL